jgi:predicted Rdx family selenoprotein
MTKGEQAEKLIREGWRNIEIVKELGITDKYVSVIRNAGGYAAMLQDRRDRWNLWARRNGLPSGRHRSNKRAFTYDADKIRALVDLGFSYRQAAKAFNVTKNVVAGVMNRRPEARVSQ